MMHIELSVLNYLVNALWQVPLVCLIAALAARVAKRTGPQIEHRIWVAALIIEAALPAFAFAPGLRGLFAAFFRGCPVQVTTQATILNVGAIQAQSQIMAVVALIALVVYAVAVLFVAARLLYRLHLTRSLCHKAQILVPAGDLLAIWQRCARTFAVHDAQLATSTGVMSPSTIGLRRRIVLLPPSLLTDFPHEDLAAALAHEFAHMRRRDFAKNLFYELVALPIAWHPLLWFTRFHVSESREMVCDEIAAQATHGATQYAHSLLRLAESFSRLPAGATVHAIGIFDANGLERRVMELSRNSSVSTTSRRAAIVAALALCIATCASAMSLRFEVPASAVLFVQPIAPAPALSPSGARQSGAPLRLASGLVAGRLISRVNPTYPPIALAAHVQGTVLLHAVIGSDGTIQQLTVIDGPSMLVASAMDAVRQWVYKPYMLNGEPTEVETTISVSFSLNGQNNPPAPPPPPPGSVGEPGGSIAGVYNIGGGVTPPVAIYTSDPQYSEAARKAKLSGNVIVSLIVDSSGVPQNVRVARGLGNDLDEKAIEAVQQYRFKPATKDGEPVAAYLMVQVNFQIF